MDRLKSYYQKEVCSLVMGKVPVMREYAAMIALVLVGFFSFWSPSQAQITITMDEIPSIPGVTSEYSVEAGDSIPVDLGLAGGPQLWDFSQNFTTDTTDTVVERIVALEDTPFSQLFPGANLVQETGTVDLMGFDTASGYQFMNVNEGSLDFLGFGFQDTAGNPLGINLASPLTMIPLPLQYGSTWNDEADFSGTFRIENPEGSPLPGDSLNVKIDLEYRREGQVDGWGTVRIPYGQYEALRVRRYETTQVDFSVFVYFSYVSVYADTITMYIYDWYTENLGAVATVTGRVNEEDSLFSTAMSARKLIWTNALEERPGDINGDGVINVQDVVMSVNHIMEIESLEGNALERADCNADGQIDLLDVFGLVSAILGVGECEPSVKAPGVTQEILEYLETLKPYFEADDFSRFMALVKGESRVPMEYTLEQNHPNPFNATTDIGYQIPDCGSPGHTTLKIYNMLGREVVTLVDDMKEPGLYKATWNGRDAHGSDVASGVYFCRLTAGNFTATRRMLLMK
ncbi:MAG: T9SS type A sorting domain-containing protein [Gemmatimonadota bacterium]|nr:MAG: T9SS type A sorting domain-containing protein [Gemmatimonadota bacterium]